MALVHWREFGLREVAEAHESIISRAKALKCSPRVKLWAAPNIAGIQFKIAVNAPPEKLVAPELANASPQGVRQTSRQTYTLLVPSQKLPPEIRKALNELPSKPQVSSAGHLWKITDQTLLLRIIHEKVDSKTEARFRREIERIGQEAAERINALRAR